jgi:hypothetical protein
MNGINPAMQLMVTDCLLNIFTPLHGKRKPSEGTVAAVDLQNQMMERTSQCGTATHQII